MFASNLGNDPDPVVIKAPNLPATSLSVASTTLTISSTSKTSFNDLSILEGIPQIRLPHGALTTSSESDFNAGEDEEGGGRLGKFCTMRKLSREMSIDSVISEDNDGTTIEMGELFTRLLLEADRVGHNTGRHVKVVKLTTSRTNPYKTLLRHQEFSPPCKI